MLQLSQRALTESSLDEELFVGRVEEMAAVERALGLGFNIYISGPPGSGKTSLLHRLTAKLHRMPVINLARSETFREFVVHIARGVSPPSSATSVTPHIPTDQLLKAFQRLSDPMSGYGVEEDADRLEPLKAVLQRHGNVGPLFLDNVDPKLRHELFGRQRDELWELPLQWVVTGDNPHLQPPADAFFETSLHLEPLQKSEMREVLLRRTSGGTPGERLRMQKLIDTLPNLLGPTTPRNLLASVRAILIERDTDAALGRFRRQRLQRRTLSEAAQQVLDELTSLGPTHAGDHRLLGSIGVSRSRAVQILRELEDAGLVRSTRDGRRKLYAVNIADRAPENLHELGGANDLPLTEGQQLSEELLGDGDCQSPELSSQTTLFIVQCVIGDSEGASVRYSLSTTSGLHVESDSVELREGRFNISGAFRGLASPKEPYGIAIAKTYDDGVPCIATVTVLDLPASGSVQRTSESVDLTRHGSDVVLEIAVTCRGKPPLKSHHAQVAPRPRRGSARALDLARELIRYVRVKSLPRTIHVFISHSHKDAEIASALADYIRAAAGLKKIHIFSASDQIYGPSIGSEWIRTLKQAIGESKIVVFLISQNFLLSKFCAFELGAAWLTKERIQCYPILIGDIGTGEFDALLASWQYTTLSEIALVDLRERILEQCRLIPTSMSNADGAVRDFLESVAGPLVSKGATRTT